MKSLAKTIQVLSGQLNGLNEVPILGQLCRTVREFPIIMKKWSTSSRNGWKLDVCS